MASDARRTDGTGEDARPALRRGIYAIVDVAACRVRGLDPVATARAFCTVPLAALQLRAKDGTDRERVDLARAVAPLCRAAHIPFVVNDRADVAVLVDADGVHLGQEDPPPARVRGIIGPRRLVGLSTHGPEQVDRAAAEPVDYLGYGPIFATSTKERADPIVGPAGLRDAAARSTRPVVAIGGIRLEDLPAVRDAGAHAAALIAALLDGDPAERIAAAVRLFGRRGS
jgi:thiamine-phosphate diphosphorylase